MWKSTVSSSFHPIRLLTVSSEAILKEMALNFDEFTAARQRAKSREAEEAAAKEAKKERLKATNSAVNASKDVEKELLSKIGKSGAVNNATPKATKTSSMGLGEFLEMIQMQSLICGMIVLDTFVSFFEMYLIKEKLLRRTSATLLTWTPFMEAMLTFVQSFTSFTILFFGLEMFTVFLVFRMSFFGHIGYLFDMMIVFSQLYMELLGGSGKETRLLNIFRLWRTVRLFHAVVNLEKIRHEKTKDALTTRDAEIRRLKMNIQSIETEVLKEKEAKESVEQMLFTYKEEIDTLNEALKIAAMDIAEVAQADDGDFDSEEGTNSVDGVEDEDDEEEEADRGRGSGGDRIPLRRKGDIQGSELDDIGEHDFVDAAASVFDGDKKRNRETLLKLVRRDAEDGIGSVSTASKGGMSSASSSRGQTFVIHEDGSFVQKK